MSDGFPDRTVRRDGMTRHACAGFDCGTRGEALDACSVKGAVTRPFVSRGASDAQVPELAVIAAEDGASLDDQTNTYARADGDIRKVGQAAGRPPAALSKRGSIDVSVESERNTSPQSQGLQYVRATPAALCIRGDLSEGRGARAQVEWTERGDANGVGGSEGAAPLIQNRIDLRQRLLRAAGCNADPSAYVIRS